MCSTYTSSIVLLLLACYLGYVYRIDDSHVVPLKRQRVTPVNKETGNYIISTLYFPCSSIKCEAFFYKPKGVFNPPVIIMAHGFGAQKDFGLEKFADGFARNDYAVFLFDYRTFGGSEGEPMNLISPPMHLEDWESALAYVLDLPSVDNNSIILWGSSFSGGHVIVTAAKSPNRSHIKGVISQVPYLRALSSLSSLVSHASLTDIVKLSFFGLVDITRDILGLSRYYVPIYGHISDMAILCSPSAAEYVTIIPEHPRGGWQNKCPASIALCLTFYNPHSFVQDLRVPTLMIYDTKDDLCPAEDILEVAKTSPIVELTHFSSGHFAPYNREFEENLKRQLQFLEKIDWITNKDLN